MATPVPKESEIERKWFIVDAEGQVLGRLATRVASILRGKHKTTFTPHLDVGDHVIVVNAEKVHVTGRKRTDKMYRWHSGYIGGLREVSFELRCAPCREWRPTLDRPGAAVQPHPLTVQIDVPHSNVRDLCGTRGRLCQRPRRGYARIRQRRLREAPTDRDLINRQGARDIAYLPLHYCPVRRNSAVSLLPAATLPGRWSRCGGGRPMSPKPPHVAVSVR